MKHRSNNMGRHAWTSVAVAAACLLAGPAWSLGLGRLSVQSTLGEALRAEIAITNITAEEASTLQLRVASPDVYRAAGVDYNAALASAQVQLEKRADGSSVLQLTSSRAVTEPFVDVILEASWASGRLVRAYTLLLDPPATAAAPAPVSPPVVSAVPAPRPAPAASPARAPAPATPSAPSAPASAPAPVPATVPAPTQPPARASVPAPAPAPATAASPAPAPSDAPDRVNVRSGDTLSGIAERVRPESVSLDQMLVSLFRANPRAFFAENMNRLKAGAVLEVPSAADASAIEPVEARQIIVAQSIDFDAYRQRLASNVAPAPAVESSSRQATGTVQAQVEDRRGTAPAPDQLKLSQGALQASSPEASVSRETAQRDAAARVAELARNVEELKRLQSEAAPPAVAPASTAASATETAAVPDPTAAAASMAAASQADLPRPAAASAVASRPAAARPAPEPVPEETPSFIDELLDNPFLLPGAGALVLLLLGFGVYKMRGRAGQSGGETSFLESRLQPDSFFHASGGQRVDTREAPSSTGASSMSYSLSQLDAIGDVDPVAEADVYLAYGRDLQAEEILRDAMRQAPERQAIRLKLLEVYAKRRDTKGFEVLATQVFTMTRGEGDDWRQAQELGRSIDPENPLYAAGGQPGAPKKAVEPAEALSPATVVQTQFSPPAPAPAEVGNLSTDLDIDLDIDLDAATDVSNDDAFRSAEMTLPLGGGMQLPDIGPASGNEPMSMDPNVLDFDIPAPSAPAVEPAPRSSGNTGFGGLDFELETPPQPMDVADEPPMSGFEPSGSPDDIPPVSEYGGQTDSLLDRKLELAEEFRQIGDMEGARDLLEEVIAKADGALKTKAQLMLDQLA